MIARLGGPAALGEKWAAHVTRLMERRPGSRQACRNLLAVVTLSRWCGDEARRQAALARQVRPNLDAMDADELRGELLVLLHNAAGCAEPDGAAKNTSGPT
jgi:hypothetical protein